MKTTIATLLISLASLLLFGCSSTLEGDKEVAAPLQPLSCIAVLPAFTPVDWDETISFEQAQTLEKGAAFATRVISTQLSGNDKVRILTSEQVSALVPEVTGGVTGAVTALGERVNCDGVLITTVRRFEQRDGTEMSADSPASANFSMSLRHAASGTVLWSGDFNETQKSFLSNIFSYTKMKKRGFKWITVEQLMEEGLTDRLAECPYLQ